MLRMTRVFASSLAVFLLAGAMAPASANAWPLGKGSHLHPDADQHKAALIAIQFHNRGKVAQDVKVDGTTYTIPPLQSVTIKAPLGVSAYVDSDGEGHAKGDLLLKYGAELKGATVSFN